MPLRPPSVRRRLARWALLVAGLAPVGAAAAIANAPPGPVPRRPAPPPPPAPPTPPTPPVAPMPPTPPTPPPLPPTPHTPPTLADAGEPTSQRESLEGLGERTPPDALVSFSGRWVTLAEPGVTPANVVLSQDQTTDPWAVALFQGKGRAIADGVVRVRFRPVSGEVDAAGGIVFRAQDEKNYYLVRSNGLEDNLRLYVMKDGQRQQLASVTVDPPALGTWHTLEVRVAGTKMRARVDDGPSVEADDPTFARGWCGLWTKADSVTWFDDWSVEPTGKETSHAAPGPVPTPKDPATPPDAPKDPLPGGGR